MSRETCLRGGYQLWRQAEEARKRLEERAKSLNEWLDGVKGR